MCMYIYIYIYIYRGSDHGNRAAEAGADEHDRALLYFGLL